MGEKPTAVPLVLKSKAPIKTERLYGFLRYRDLDVSFGEGFPYFIRKETVDLLTNLVYPFLKKPQYAHFCDPDTRRILLTGPPGSELYQQTIVKALARQMHANLFIVRPDESAVAECQAASQAAQEDASTEAEETGKAISSLLQEKILPGFKKVIGTGVADVSTDSGLTVVRLPPSKIGAPEGKGAELIGDMVQLSTLINARRQAKIAAGASPDEVYMDEYTMEDGDVSFTVHVEETHEDHPTGIEGENDEDATIHFHSSPVSAPSSSSSPLVRISSSNPLKGDSSDAVKDSDASAPSTESKEGKGPQKKPYLEQLIAAALEYHQPSTQPYILYIPDIEGGVFSHASAMSQLKNALTSLTGPVVVIASRISLVDLAMGSDEDDHGNAMELSVEAVGPLPPSVIASINSLQNAMKRDSHNITEILTVEDAFPTEVQLAPPPLSNSEVFGIFSKQMQHDSKALNIEKNVESLCKALEKAKLRMPVRTWTETETTELLQNQVFYEEASTRIVGYAASRQLREPRSPRVRDGYMLVQPQSLRYAIDLYKNADETDSPAARALKDVDVDNKYEKALLGEVIPATEINVRFGDIGALENQKQALKEVVMLPLQRPELFRRGNLTKPVKGVLLFGPPGTGKTLLAKAIATEAGANFINVTASAVQSMWYGESEKYINALFTLARKLQPCVIFCDEVDSMLGRRSGYEHEGTRRLKNEFMQFWDGLKTRADERVLVLGATNRPFDLDEAVLRRFPRRFLVDLPNKEQREQILRVILASEDLGADVDIPALAIATEGYSGSDLKNLCVSAAYVPIRELIENEKTATDQANATTTTTTASSNTTTAAPKDSGESKFILRPLSQDDFLKAKKEVSPSVSEEEQTWDQLRKWNELYGEGGSRKKAKALGFSFESLGDEATL